MQQGPFTTFAAQLRSAAGKGADALEPAAGLPALTTTSREDLPHWPAELLALRGNAAPPTMHELAADRSRLLGGMGIAAPTDKQDASA